MARKIDRSDLMDKAARLVTRGDLTGAVSLYEQLFQTDTKDWSIGNTLGDLYIRLGKADAAIRHFTSLAEQLGADGFAAKQRALYRKILRIQPDNENAKRRVDELERHDSATVSPFLKRVLETARAARETSEPPPAATPPPASPPEEPRAAASAPAAPPPRVVAPPPVAAPPKAAPSAVAPPVVAPPAPARAPTAPTAAAASATLPASSHEWADEWAAVLSPPQNAPPPVAPAQPEPAPNWDLTDFHQVVAAADASAAQRNFAGAVTTIEQFLASQPQHIDALEKLIDVGVEGRLDDTLISAQTRLATACLRAGRTEQAYHVAFDLTERQPEVTEHRELLAQIAPQAAPRADESALPVEPWVAMPVAAPEALEANAVPSELDQAFEEIRTALLEEAAAAAEERLAEAERLLKSNQDAAAIAALQDAACAPHLRATAGSRLARVYRDRGEPLEALTCLEWVAQVPPATEESGHELAYQLALTLEAVGQQDQALGVYRELLAEVGPGYRDVAIRVDRIAAA